MSGVEPARGLEPRTFSLQNRRSANCSYTGMCIRNASQPVSRMWGFLVIGLPIFLKSQSFPAAIGRIIYKAPLFRKRALWWAPRESNPEPVGYEPTALTICARGP